MKKIPFYLITHDSLINRLVAHRDRARLTV